MVRSTKPIPVAERNEHVTNVAQRVQAALGPPSPGSKTSCAARGPGSLRPSPPSTRRCRHR